MARLVIVGGGLVGLATALRALESGRFTRVQVLEKEAEVGRHQSTHNSGVLHAGLYYQPGSLKARMAREGLRDMLEFCAAHGIAHERCGKLVIAADESEISRLRTLMERGTANGLVGLRWIGGDEIAAIEPYATGVAAVHVPEEGIVDYAAVCATMRRLITERGGEVRVGATVTAMVQRGAEWSVTTTAGSFDADRLVTCAGLHADRVARMAGETLDARIVPFRGEYWMLRPERSHLVRHLIYPVPDPTFPFLGVHFTRLIGGGVETGPNAVLALAREGYRWRDVNLRDLADALSFPGLWRFIKRYPRVVTYEVARSLRKQLFLESLRRFVPSLRDDDLVRGHAGVRAQVMLPSGDLVQDFLLVERPGAVHVINAPSPAATASLAIAREILARIPA